MPPLGPRVPKSGSWLTRAIGRGALALFGWRFEGNVPNLSKFVAIGAPHTSNWDLPLGVAAIWAVGIRLAWMGKHTLFRPPFGWFFRRLGGIPINRNAAHGIVNQTVHQFRKRDTFVLALAPEGTRSKVTQWKTGFYFMAHKAGVPIVPVALDYGRKTLRIGTPLTPSGDLDADMATIHAFYVDVTGKRPQLA